MSPNESSPAHYSAVPSSSQSPLLSPIKEVINLTLGEVEDGTTSTLFQQKASLKLGRVLRK